MKIVFLQWILDLLAPIFEWSMPRPVSYVSWEASSFHYITFGFIILFAVLLAKFYKDKPSEQIYRLIFVVGILMVIFEGLRQLYFVWQSGGIYPWYVFPFQFCSTPIYIGVIIRFIPTKIKDAFVLYLGSFSLLAGILVMLMPNDIYLDSVYINFQTTFQHGAMVILGAIAIVRAKHVNIHRFISPIVIFSTFLVLAVILNTIHNELINTPTFNMFFINPRYGTSLPVFIDIYPLVPYLVFLMIYVFGFSFGAYLIIAINNTIRFWLASLNKSRNEQVVIAKQD